MALKRPKSQKNLKETTSASSMTEECDVFNDGLDNEDCRGILLNCLKNLKKEVKYIRRTVARWSFKISQIYYRQIWWIWERTWGKNWNYKKMK